MQCPDRVLVIACGALAREIAALKRASGWTALDVTCLAPELHNRPERIPAAVGAAIREARARYRRIFVAYADCGTGGALDRMLAEEGVERLPGAHCYEVFATPAKFAALADADGVFGLVEQFDHQDGVAGLIAAANEPAVAGRLAGATLLRGDAFTRVGAFDTSLKIGETLDWMARLDAAGGRLNLVDKLVLRRRVHANNTVKRLRAAQADYLKLLKSGLDRRRSQTNPTP